VATSAEEIWKQSVRAYDRRNQREEAAQWYWYHRGQRDRHLANLDSFVTRHENEMARFAWAVDPDDGPREAA
jgi:hypothetical protein